MATFYARLSAALGFQIPNFLVERETKMNRNPKRPRSPAARCHHRSKRRRSSQKGTTPPDPEPEPEQEPAVENQVNPRSVVALLALTDPVIVSNIVHFVPQTTSRKARSQPSNVLANLVNVCRALAPFDHELPRFFGPHNHIFWREMIFHYYDFTSTPASGASELAVWPRLGVCYQPSEYGFLSDLQALRDRRAWPDDEDAFTLFCDLTLLVDKLATFVTASTPSEATQLMPCLLHPGATQPRLRPTSTSTPTTDQKTRTLRLPIREIRRSRRPLLVQIITKDLENWGKFTDASRQVECYAGRSLRSKRWLGFARFK